MKISKKMIGAFITSAFLAAAVLGCQANASDDAADSASPTQRIEANKQVVLTAYEKAMNGRDMTELNALFAEDLIQHNPQLPDGRATLAQFLSSVKPPLHGDVKRVVAEGDLVMVHAHLTSSDADRNNDFAGVAVVDIFRVANGKIVEHWDVIQQVPATSASKHSMFDGGGLYTGN